MVISFVILLLVLLLAAGLIRLGKRLVGTEAGDVLMELATGLALIGLVFVLYR